MQLDCIESKKYYQTRYVFCSVNSKVFRRFYFVDDNNLNINSENQLDQSLSLTHENLNIRETSEQF